MASLAAAAAAALDRIPDSSPPVIDCAHRHQNQQQQQLPRYVEVTVEVPRGSFVKRRPGGDVDFIAPLPCPFNYGSVVSLQSRAPDGDPMDALVLGETLPYGVTTRQRVVGLVRFTDAGLVDNKLICAQPSVKCAKRELLSCCSSRSRSRSRAVVDSFLKPDLSVLDFLTLATFFNAYAVFKTVLNSARGLTGRTSFDGVQIFS